MAETNMRRRVRKILRKYDAVSIEGAAKGTPDVNYTKGWIELKENDRWPPRGGVLRLRSEFTKEQRVWLARRCRAGGQAFLLLKVGQDWLLFNGDVAAKFVGKSDKTTLQYNALHVWEGRLNEQELLRYLCD